MISESRIFIKLKNEEFQSSIDENIVSNWIGLKNDTPIKFIKESGNILVRDTE